MSNEQTMEIIELTAEDFEWLLKLLENQTEPNQALRKLINDET